MCPRHHKIIDSNESKYTVSILRKWKKIQESKVSEEQQNVLLETLKKIELQSEVFWKSIKVCDDTDETGLKRKLEEKSIEELLQDIEEIFDSLMGNCDILADEDDKAMSQLEQLCKWAKVDFKKFDKVFYKDNPFVSRNWEIHNLAIPNISNQLKMEYFQFLILILEEITKYNHCYETILDKYRDKFKDFHEGNYYID